MDYQYVGQPVLIGGVGTCSYILTGTEKGMAETFGSTCHTGGARARATTRATSWTRVLELKTKGIAIRVASPKLVMEEAPSYKDVTEVVNVPDGDIEEGGQAAADSGGQGSRERVS